MKKKHISAKIVFGTLVCLLIFGSLYAYTKEDESNTSKYPPRSLTVAMSKLEATTLVRVARAQGYFEELNLDVRFIEDDLGKFSLGRLLNHEADLATVAEFPVVKQAFERDDLRLISTIHTSNKNVRAIIRSDSDVNSVASSSGKRIATTKGTVGEFFLHLLLLAHGVDPSDVDIVDMTPVQIQQAIDDGSIDGFSLREPHVFRAKLRLGGKAKVFPIDPIDEVYTATFNIVTTTPVLSEKTEEIRLFLAALKRAELFTRQESNNAKQLIANDLSLDQNYLDSTWSDSNFSLSLDQALLLGMEDEARWRIQNGLTDRENIPDFLKVIHTKLLREISPKSVSIIDLD